MYSNFSMKIPYFKICLFFQIPLNFHHFLSYILFNIKFHHIDSFEIMEFCNKWWNYITLLFGISISIICNNDGKGCIPLNFNYFNIILT